MFGKNETLVYKVLIGLCMYSNVGIVQIKTFLGFRYS